jgi:8-oxo-dGTP pyrophosphatase MutT (NUDIX family)
MTDVQPPGAAWHKSRRSIDGGANCVEVATNLLERDGRVYVRDSKDGGGGPVLSFTPTEWAAFTGGVRDGEFTL